MTGLQHGRPPASLLLVAVSLCMLATAAQAYTPEQQQACSGDAFRLCGSAIPDVDRVTVCMIRNRSALSPGCAAFFRPTEPVSGAALSAVRSRRPLSIVQTRSGKVVSRAPRQAKQQLKRAINSVSR